MALSKYKILLAFLCLTACSKAPLVYQVKTIVDGDTLILAQFPDIRYDLAYIDAPEREQPYGREAKAFLKTKLQDAQIEVVINSNQKLELAIAGQSINQLMVKQGLAWAKLNISDSITSLAYIEAQKQASSEGIGLWSLGHGLMIAPWQWREQATQHAPSMNNSARLKQQRDAERQKISQQQRVRAEQQMKQRAMYERSRKVKQQVSDKEPKL